MKKERLTKKEELPFDSTYSPRCECIETGSTITFGQMLAYDGVCAKLGKIEDIEEDLGIDLVTLFKALKKGIWFKRDDGLIVTRTITYIGRFGLTYIGDSLGNDDGDYPNVFNYYPYKDYGKTWALTKEELE